MHILAQFDLFEVARCCSAGHDSLPSSYVTGIRIVSHIGVVRVMSVIAEEERLDDWLIDYS